MLRRYLPFVSLILLVLVIALPAVADGGGVDDIRGRWDAKLYVPGERGSTRVRLFIDDLQLAEEPDTYLATGCMMTLRTREYAPLSLEAVDLGWGKYDLTIMSTVIPRNEEPYVVRLDGQAMTRKRGVRKDRAYGTWIAEFGDGRWWGRHHDRRNPHCPPPSEGIDWERDVWAGLNVIGDTVLSENMDLEGRAPIVSSGMRVTAPDGQVYDIPAFDDIFSPEVDFISHFRYQQSFPGLPIAGQPYHFVLLDIFGDPIPGTERTDTWYGCVQDAPHDLVADDWTSAPNVDFHFTYDGFRVAAAGFDPDPAGGAGTFKISIMGEEFSYGTHFHSTWHQAPYASFGDYNEFGIPDGSDFGQGLEEMPPGLHEIILESVSDPPAGSDGLRNECFIHDVGEIVYMERDGENYTFSEPATITGQVTEQDGGEALEGIHISACEYGPDEPMCWGQDSNENGFYWINVPPGSYRLETHSDQGWIKEFWDETPLWEDATAVDVLAGDVRNEINFTLELGGSIAGTVRDGDGNPLAGIAVDIEEGGYGQCTAEDGTFLISGVPFGTYTVVAGREFCDPHPYMEARVEGVVLTEAEPDAGGVDFTLEMGGSISGNVSEEGGPSLEGIEVGACEFGPQEPMCWGAPTDEFGNYQISGLPAGDYRVEIHSDQGWLKEYWQETPNWDDATPVLVDPGADRGGINFTLEMGGSISGVVLDESGSPLAGIAVDIEQGGYGTCTGPGGEFTLSGLPLSSYNVVAGRDFCDPHHPYLEDIQFGIDLTAGPPDVTIPDFTLETGGRISGTVSNINGDPLTIFVDIAGGGFGRCTELNGMYSMVLPDNPLPYIIEVGFDSPPECPNTIYAPAASLPIPILIGDELLGVDFVLFPN